MKKIRFTKDTYQDYLKSEYWLNFRAEAVFYFDYKCWFCGSKTDLQLHHTRYTRKSIKWGGKVKNNLRWFLLLCKHCHQGIHKLQKERGLNVYQATKIFKCKYFPQKKIRISLSKVKRLGTMPTGRTVGVGAQISQQTVI